MSLFDPTSQIDRKNKKFRPFYRVYTSGTDGDQLDHDPDCVVEAVAVGQESHYVIKKPDGTVDGMYPFNSVECIWRVTEDESEE